MKIKGWKQTCIKDTEAAPKERKHIILLDGTWNDETGVKLDGFVTNIVNLHRILPNDEEKQVVRYHRGVGNGDDNGRFHTFWGGVTGRGVRKIVDRAYARFIQDWQSGDTIYIFGFSRGAAAARMLAAKIHNEGIPGRITVTVEPMANKETLVIEQVLTDVELVANPAGNHKVDIEFLGIWDTVSAFGLKTVFGRYFFGEYKDLFTNNHIANNIKRAVHLVAIDETRNPFVPSLMNRKEGVVHEVWFPGVHSDIGGSYMEDNIARVTLSYMIRMLTEWNTSRGLPDFIIDHEKYNAHTTAETDKLYFHFHGDARGCDLRNVFVQVDGQRSDSIPPKIHDLYNVACNSKLIYSVIEQGHGDKKEKKFINFQYMPFNVKVLQGRFEVVK